MAGNQLKKFLPVQRYFSPWKWKYNLHTTEFVFPITVKVIFDFTDNQEVIDAILYGVEDKSPAYYTDIPKMTRLAHLECLANMTGNRNFIEAVKKQQRLIGAK